MDMKMDEVGMLNHLNTSFCLYFITKFLTGQVLFSVFPLEEKSPKESWGYS
jgi:hypothetical protein